jgi:hypothetical protein
VYDIRRLKMFWSSPRLIVCSSRFHSETSHLVRNNSTSFVGIIMDIDEKMMIEFEIENCQHRPSWLHVNAVRDCDWTDEWEWSIDEMSRWIYIRFTCSLRLTLLAGAIKSLDMIHQNLQSSPINEISA